MKTIRRMYKGNLGVMLIAILLFILAMVFFLPMMSDANGNIPTPDSDFGYDTQKLEVIRSSYTDENIRSYTFTRFTYDIVWPLVYTFFFVATIGYMTASINDRRWVSIIYAFPIISIAFDLLENTMCSLYFNGVFMGITGILAPVMSGLKWLAIFITFAIQGGLIVYHIGRVIKNRLAK